jgi:hypothetical protein
LEVEDRVEGEKRGEQPRRRQIEMMMGSLMTKWWQEPKRAAQCGRDLPVAPPMTRRMSRSEPLDTIGQAK